MTKALLFPPTSSMVIEIVAFDAVQLLDVTGPLQVFASANDVVAASGAAPPYEPRVVSASGPLVTCSAGLAMAASPLPPVAAKLDTLIVPGGQGVDAAAADPSLVAWLRERVSAARRTASVCTGAFLLASAGLLDGRRSATHWARCAELAERYPAVMVEPDPIFVHDRGIWSSAGVTAGIDLSLALVEQDLGRAVALAVARDLVVFLKRPGGQAQFSVALRLQAAGYVFEGLHAWIAENLDDDLTLSSMAARCGMSERSFSRRYLAVAGLTPARAVERLRVEAARRLLIEGRLPIKAVARQCGFGSEETMRRSFTRLLSTSPQDYRARFGV